MKKKNYVRLCLFRFIFLCLLGISFVNCESEKDFLEAGHNHAGEGKVGYLTGAEAKRIENIVKEALRNRSSSQLNARMQDLTVDYSKILEVVNAEGIKNYTFKIINHPDDNYKTFHNLILNSKPNEGLELYMYQYIMTEEFAAAYNQGYESILRFRGYVKPTIITSAEIDPCEQLEPLFVYNPTSPNNGSGFDPGDFGMPGNGTTTPVAPGGGGSGGGNPCIVVTLRYQCSCGTIYNSMMELQDAGCGVTVGGVVYTSSVVVSYSLAESCRMGVPCLGDGEIGILAPDMEDPCEQLKKLSQNIKFTSKMNLLKYNIPNGTVEKGFRLNEMNNGENSAIIEGTAYGTVEMRLEQIATNEELFKTYGFAHNHLASRPDHIGIFTPQDIGPLFVCGNIERLSDNPWRSDIPQKAIIFVTTNRGLFAMKINDMTKLEAFIENTDFWNPAKFKKFIEEKFQVKDEYNILPTSSHDEQVIGFLRFMQDYDIGVDLYEGNQSNYLNWRKLNLVNHGNDNFSFTETPCNP